MRALDANLLIYAYSSVLPQHHAARAWLEGVLASGQPTGIPWPSLLAFMRIVTNPKFHEQPATFRAAWAQIEEWLALDNVWVPLPTDRHAAVLATLVEEIASPNDVPDAHLAAIAIEHGLELCSSDRDFARYPGLRWSNPLATG